MSTAVRVEGLAKRYGTVRAVDGVWEAIDLFRWE